MSKKFLILCFFLLSVVAVIKAQTYNLFTADNELPSSSINSIYQDRHGFVWIATENGLVKYDGARFITYNSNRRDPHTLAHDFVTCMVEDHKGNLFVSTYSGVQVYDYNSDTFSENVVWSDGSAFGENANTIFCGNSGNVYVAGHSVSSVDYNNVVLTANKVVIDGDKNFSKICQDTAGKLWISNNNSASIYRQTSSDSFIKYSLSNGKKQFITDFVITDDGVVYCAVFGSGIEEYNGVTDSFETIVPELADVTIRCIFPTTDKLYIVGEVCGLFVYDRRKRTLSNYDIELGNTSLKDYNVTSIIKDRDGNIWMGIVQKGVMMIPSVDSPFKYLGQKSSDLDIIGKGAVSAIHKDSSGNIWIGTNGDGCYCIDSKVSRQLLHLDRPVNVTSFYEDPQGNIWITASNGGVSLLEKGSARPKLMAISFENNPITTAHQIAEDNQGRMWIATMGFGLYCYDPIKKATESINAINPYVHNWLTTALVDKSGQLWLGTYDGLEKPDIKSVNYESERFLKRTIVYSMVQDKANNLWLATSDGLFNMNTNGDTIRVYTVEDGLPSQSLASVVIDDNGLLWITSNSGLSRFDPQTGSFANFFSGDGLQGNEFCKNSSFKDEDGGLWFGGNNGLTYFSPKDISSDNNPWHVRIVAMTLANEDITTTTLSGGKLALKSPVFETDHVSLAHSDNNFNIYFATEELNRPDMLQFEYCLNDQSWQRLPVGVRSVSFSNLASGAYKFSVRAVNNQRGSTIKTFYITIRPVWYNTWWARSLSVLLVLVFLVLVFLIVRAHYREINDRLMSEKQTAMHDAQTRFFIDITHEIRTPLTLIIDPIRKLLSSDNDTVRRSSYITIERNANRILRIMNQMIDVRKIDKGVLNLKFVEQDIVEILDVIYADFQEQAMIKHIDFKFIHNDIDSLSVWVDYDYFDKIVVNLVSNALKYTQFGGHVEMVLTKVDDKSMKLAVIDNGIGIPFSDRSKIFDRFYRSKSAEEIRIKGSGIGLSLTKSLVELHHGTISVVSSTEKPSGSIFTVELPLGRKHLSDIEIASEIPETSFRETTSVIEPVISDQKKVHTKTKYRILVADDEDEIRDYLQKELSGDFHVAVCYNGKEALSMLLQEKFDLIVSDVMMPGMDGETLCRKVRTNINLNHIPVILLTANTEEQAIISGLENGADEYLVKPLSINLLRTRIYNLLHSREMLYNNYSRKQIDDDKLKELHVKSPDEQLMERIMRAINNNLDNPELSVEMLADKVGMSRVHLNRKLKELTNQTARDFIRNVRLKQAATLLGQNKYPINRVAELVGFTNAGNFTTAFRTLYGVSPKDYNK